LAFLKGAKEKGNGFPLHYHRYEVLIRTRKELDRIEGIFQDSYDGGNVEMSMSIEQSRPGNPVNPGAPSKLG
jgi:hypothetical protein